MSLNTLQGPTLHGMIHNEDYFHPIYRQTVDTFCEASEDLIPNRLGEGNRISVPGARIDKKAKGTKAAWETLRADSCVHVNTRQDCATDELCTLVRATRHCTRMGVGGPRIRGRNGRPLINREPDDVLLAGFESGYGHAVDQNARESELFKLSDGLSWTWIGLQYGWTIVQVTSRVSSKVGENSYHDLPGR